MAIPTSRDRALGTDQSPAVGKSVFLFVLVTTFLIPSAVGGGLLSELGSRVPFYAAASTALVTFLFGYFILPESLPRHKRRPFTWVRANSFRTLI